MDKELNLARYFTIFCIVYVLAQGSVFVLLTIFNVGGGNAGTTTAALAGTVYYVCSVFIKDYQRIPTKAEKLKLAIVSLLGSFIVSGVFVSIFLTLSKSNEAKQVMGLLTEANIPFMLVLSAFFALFYFLILWLFYVLFSKFQFKSMMANEKI